MSVEAMKRMCPLCGKDNNCQHEQGGCWCDSLEFPKYILDMIPEDRKGKACICRACLEKFQK